nr:glycosyltransferase [uncultured Psychroserpens sp.]
MAVNPLISVCIPTYNGAQFICEAMDSVLNQTYSNIEIIVSDDTSNDNTLELVNKYIDKSQFPIYIYTNVDRGIGNNWNNSMQKANGKYIKFLFQDDVLLPNCIEMMYNGLELKPNAGLVACKREFIIDDNVDRDKIDNWLKIYGDLQNHLNLDFKPVALITKSIFKSKQFYAAPVNFVGEPSAVMFKKNLIDDIGYFRDDLNQFLDFEYWFQILKKTPIIILKDSLIKFRIHENQATQKNKGKMSNDIAILKKILYKEFFWLLSRYRQKQLFLEFNPLGKLINKLLNYK